MTSERESNFGFAASHDAPIPYLQRIRDYYQALGYGAPYKWAHYSEVPFRRLDKPLSKTRVTIITTAAPYQPDKGDQGPGAPYNAAAKFYTVYSGDTAKDHDLRISHIAIDRKHTTAEDPATYFPLNELRQRRPALEVADRLNVRITGSSVPEPTTSLIVITGLALLGLTRRLRKAVSRSMV